MLRISCSCGKVLKVNEDLAGKKIKCPGCATVLTVKAAAAPIASRPLKPAPRDEDDEAVASGPPVKKKVVPPADEDGPSTPIPKKKKPVADEDDEAPPPKKKMRDDDLDDEDNRPRKKKKKSEKKGSGMMLVLLLGGGFFFLLLLAGGGLGAYFLFFRDKSSNPGAPGSGPGSKGEPVPVKFHVPLKVGDVREMTGTMERKTQATGTHNGKQDNHISNTKATFHAKVKTLSVTSDGQQISGEITLLSMNITIDDGDGKVITSKMPEGLVVVQKQADFFGGLKDAGGKEFGGLPDMPKLFTYEPKDFKAMPNDGWRALASFGEIFGKEVPSAGVTEDTVYGTADKKAVGDSWSVNKASIAKLLSQKGGFLGAKIGEDAISGTVKFDGAPKEAGNTYLDFKVDGKVNMAGALMELMKTQPGPKGQPAPKVNLSVAEVTFTESFRMPEGYKTGPVKVSHSSSSRIAGEVLDGPDAGKGSMEESESVSMDIKYLGSDGGGSGGKEDPKQGTYAVAVSNVTAARNSVNKSYVDVKFRYTAAGEEPKDRASLAFFAVPMDAGGIPGQPILLGTVGLPPNGKEMSSPNDYHIQMDAGYTGLSIIVSTDPNGKGKEKVGSSASISISGSGGPVGGNKLAVSVIGQPSLNWVQGQSKVNVSLAYQSSGTADPGSTVYFYVTFQGKDGKSVYQALTIAGSSLQPNGTLSKQLDFNPSTLASTNVCDIVVVLGKADNSSVQLDKRQQVAISGTPSTSPGSTTGGVVFDLSSPKVELPGVNQVKATVSYQIPSGTIDQNAQYRLMLDPKSPGKPAVAITTKLGSQLGQTGTLSDTAFAQGLTAGSPVELYVVEISAKNQQGVTVSRSNAQTTISGGSSPGTGVQVGITQAAATYTLQGKQGMQLHFYVQYKVQGEPKQSARYVCKAQVLLNGQQQFIDLGNGYDANGFKNNSVFTQSTGVLMAQVGLQVTFAIFEVDGSQQRLIATQQAQLVGKK
jgi:hypothetical protein